MFKKGNQMVNPVNLFLIHAPLSHYLEKWGVSVPLLCCYMLQFKVGRGGATGQAGPGEVREHDRPGGHEETLTVKYTYLPPDGQPRYMCVCGGGGLCVSISTPLRKHTLLS